MIEGSWICWLWMLCCRVKSPIPLRILDFPVWWFLVIFVGGGGFVGVAVW